MSQTLEKAFAKTFSDLYDEDAFNGVVVISKNGEITYKEAFGIADIETEEELKTTSIFNLASVSKQFTAMCVMILQERGALNYDDSITEYLTELPYENITIRHLLHHTSGLTDYEENENNETSTFITNDDLLAWYSAHKPKLLFKVGERYEYSNTGYAFLASIVERTSGEYFEIFLQQNIFEPLGMRHSFGLRRPNKPPKKIAQGFRENEDEEYEDASYNYFDGIIGDGNIFCSAEDLAIYDFALTECTLVSQETMEEALTSGTLNNGESIDYGFGWEIDEAYVSHDGAWEAYNTYFGRDLSEGYAIIVLDNSDNPDVFEAIEEALEEYYE